jgi:DNA-directed RNA polymerase specialized sigma24 family protein
MGLECKEKNAQDEMVEAVRNFLCSYQVCLDMLNLRKTERKRARVFEDPFECGDVLAGGEAFWKARMYEVRGLLAAMRNGREKVLLYYHYIRGMSIEHAADMMGISRRTGYRIHQRGLLIVSFLYHNKRKNDEISELAAFFEE